ncbi:DUF2442 domain-containing protein [candidate division KSB1 bacterium]|nr:DUF2442 domain-containing protein [candidate division KSB1 bacterium]RQW05479.1 MAG: DUF2442 domain-containing protein [candidate division KSB1 bacterium]
MNPRVKDVKPSDNYTLILTFTNNEVKIFDLKPYLDIGIFKELRQKSKFNSVRPFFGSIKWQTGQDLCPDTLYMESEASVEDENTQLVVD